MTAVLSDAFVCYRRIVASMPSLSSCLMPALPRMTAVLLPSTPLFVTAVLLPHAPVCPSVLMPSVLLRMTHCCPDALIRYHCIVAPQRSLVALLLLFT
jgi:hypothetical protein